jgi:hypothetical protein
MMKLTKVVRFESDRRQINSASTLDRSVGCDHCEYQYKVDYSSKIPNIIIHPTRHNGLGSGKRCFGREMMAVSQATDNAKAASVATM